jgi:hypothetical protein
MDKISLTAKFALFEEQWRPKVIAKVNGQEIKIVKVEGEFPWHQHEGEDEFFLAWKGMFASSSGIDPSCSDPASASSCREPLNIGPARTRKRMLRVLNVPAFETRENWSTVCLQHLMVSLYEPSRISSCLL